MSDELQLPPHSQPAEKALLGGLLRYPPGMDAVSGIVEPESMYFSHHGLIFAAMKRVVADGKPLDLVTLHNDLVNHGTLADMGGAAYLAELYDEIATGASVEYHAKIVADKALLRRLIGIGSEMARDAQDQVGPGEELLADAEVKLSQLRLAGAKRQLPPTLQEVMGETMERIDRRASQRDAGALMSGFDQIDAMTGGWHGGELVCIGARTSVGKTAMMQAFATNFAKAGRKGLLVCLEMSRVEMAQRFLVNQSGVENWRVRSANHVGAVAEDLLATAAKLKSLGIRLDDEPGLTVSRLASKARILKRKGELAWLAVDYLQLLTPDNKKIQRHEQIATMSRALKMLAQELDVPVFILSQLNRSADESNDPPRLSSLRESGSIEQDCDSVILLHRPFDERPPRDQSEAIDLIMAKQRAGETGTIRLSYLGSLFRFQGDVPKM